MLGVVIEVLKFVGEKEDLFAVFPIGTTIQDGGKTKFRAPLAENPIETTGSVQ